MLGSLSLNIENIFILNAFQNTKIKFEHLHGNYKIIHFSGGAGIVKECKDYIKHQGNLNEGDVFTSSGGKLQAQYIVHVVSPHWENGKRKEKEVLKEAVFKAMHQATKKNAKSVAIPALGCGNYGFPLKVATQIIAMAVKDFFREEQDSSVEEVYFVDVKPMTVNAFSEAVKTVFENVREFPQNADTYSSDEEQARHSSIRSRSQASSTSDISGTVFL